MTHAYFCFYHALGNVCLRRASAAGPPGSAARLVAMGAVVFFLSYATAFMETLTIAHFPYYKHKVCWLRHSIIDPPPPPPPPPSPPPLREKESHTASHQTACESYNAR